MNRNEIIRTAIGKTLGYVVQGFVYSEVTDSLSPQSAVLLKTSCKYGTNSLKYTSNNFIRKDFSSETLFKDTIDASFNAD